ncbi:MAG: NAD(P)H-hydrate dehydratase [Spirochaetes bacterium]|nr:NAD(P)H-hydrate dehydratase [Spirochaetota bacterium]
MKAVTALEMKEIDRATINDLGLSGTVLMGLAGKAVADHITGKHPWIKSAAVFTGTGNNGGDGFVTAYFLAGRGVRADVFIVGDEKKIAEPSRGYYELCKKNGNSIAIVSGAEDLRNLELKGYGCIVDALLGTGFSGTPRGAVGDVIRIINDSGVYVVAVDVPSGLGSDGAAPVGETVVADCTVTIGLPKLSLVTYPGKDFAGEVNVADIGFPKSLTESDNLNTELIDSDFFSKHSIREIESEYCGSVDTHKSARGHLLIVGGFDGMEGAALMAAAAAFECGVGLATLLTTPSARAATAGRIPELMTMQLPEPVNGGAPRVEDIQGALETALQAKRCETMLIGPGMGRGPYAKQVFAAAMPAIQRFGIKKVIIDGDGLFHLDEIYQRQSLDWSIEWIITPHFMEASRLMGISVDAIKSNRHQAAGRIARQYTCTVVLKGPASIVSNGTQYLINTTGGPALATAGSGDVLSGIIGALSLRRLSALQAAALGAWIHGKAAEVYCSGNRCDVLKSTDIITCIRAAKQSF